MAVKNNRRVKITQMILKETLIELLKEKEISKISIRELCEKADLNRSTFYLHYQSQYELLNSIEEEVIQNTLEQFKNDRLSLSSPDAIELFLTHIKENGDLFSILLCRKESADFREKLITRTVSQLSRSLEFKYDDELLPYVYTFLMEGCSGILIRWIDESFSRPTSEIASLIFTLCQSARLAEMR